MNAYIVISDTSNSYFELRQAMITLSEKMKAEIDTMGREFDEKKNLICLPNNYGGGVYAGDYFPRRYPSKTLSLEYLTYYMDEEKTTEKTMALVVLIADNRKDAEKKWTEVKKYSKSAFILNSPLYMGCRH